MPAAIVTCGTTILAKLSVFYARRNDEELSDLAYRAAGGHPRAEQALRGALDERHDELEGFLRQQADPSTEPGSRAAELNVLWQLEQDETWDIALIHAENLASADAAELLQKALAIGLPPGSSVTRHQVSGLTPDLNDFERTGYESLIEVLTQQVDRLRERYGAPPLVVGVGGFKVLPIMASVIGLIAGCEILYLYLTGERPVRVGPFPLGINRWQADAWLQSLPALHSTRPFIERVLRDQRHPLPYLVNSNSTLDLSAVTDAISEHVNRWNDAELWREDRLPQMVEHQESHSRKVDEHAMRVLLHAQQLTNRFSGKHFFALSSAAWLHDIGHAGALLRFPSGELHFVRDYQHVRSVHGQLSKQLVRDRDDIFSNGVQILGESENFWRTTVGLLCAYHQRHTILEKSTDGPHARPLKCRTSTDCEICDGVRETLEPSLEESYRDLGWSDSEVGLWVELAAILRIADAADLGQHRVSGRHLVGGRAWKRYWLRLEAAKILEDIEQNAGSAAQRVREKLEEFVRYVGDLPASEDMKGEGFGPHLARLEGFRDFLDSQERHAALHRSFTDSRIQFGSEEGGCFAIRLSMDPLVQSDPNTVDRALEYVWTEYLPVAPILERANLRLCEVVIRRGNREERFGRDTISKKPWYSAVDSTAYS